MNEIKVFKFLVTISGVKRIIFLKTHQYIGQRVSFKQVTDQIKKICKIDLKLYRIQIFEWEFKEWFEVFVGSEVWCDDLTQFKLEQAIDLKVNSKLSKMGEIKTCEPKFFKFLVTLNGVQHRVYFQTQQYNGRKVRFNKVLKEIKKINKNIEIDSLLIEVYDRDFKGWARIKENLNDWIDNMARIKIEENTDYTLELIDKWQFEGLANLFK